ncbi:MAG TPA: hypothetical protein PLI62_07120 [Spirochaetota bacterium]|nr:hypothetical protein [Spirochaetota bacterium]
MKLLHAVEFLIIVSLCCNGSQVRVEHDNMGRVQQRSLYKNNSLQIVETISYEGKSVHPAGISIKRVKHGGPELFREVEFKYRNGLLASEYFYIYRNGVKTRTGKVFYTYNGSHPEKIRYYAISDIETSRVFLSALDMYSVADGNGIQSRRIIEYEYNTQTKKGMQVSQYVVQYDKKNIVLMQTWVLDKKSDQIITKTVTNRGLISEMIHNIERSISDRVKGTMFFQDSNGAR